MSKKLTYAEVKSIFNAKGLTLTSEHYINNKIKLHYICKKCGYSNETDVITVKNSKGCPRCNNTVYKYKIDDVILALSKERYKLISTVYDNSCQRLQVECNRGHIITLAFRDWVQGCRCLKCYLEDVQKINISKLDLPFYDTYASKLVVYQEVHEIIRVINNVEVSLLGVNCLTCGKIFIPSTSSVFRRLNCINGVTGGESNLYCSEDCKDNCSVFGKHKYPKGIKQYRNIRPDQKQWAAIVKERDNYTCQKCGSTEGTIVAHHIEPVIENPIESADIDNGIALCQKCHNELHSLPGCKSKDLRCNKNTKEVLNEV